MKIAKMFLISAVTAIALAGCGKNESSDSSKLNDALFKTSNVHPTAANDMTAEDYKKEFLKNGRARITISVCIANPNDESPDGKARCAGARAAAAEQGAAEMAAKEAAEKAAEKTEKQ